MKQLDKPSLSRTQIKKLRKIAEKGRIDIATGFTMKGKPYHKFDGNAHFAVMDKDGGVVAKRVGGACHYGLAVHGVDAPHLILNIMPTTGYKRYGGASPQLDGHYRFLYNWLLNVSPFRGVHYTSTPDSAIRYGVLSRTDVPYNFLGCSMVVLRTIAEYDCLIGHMKWYVKQGVHPNLAYLLCLGFNKYGDEGSINTTPEHHYPLDINRMDRDGVFRFIRGEMPRNDNLAKGTYEGTGRYNCKDYRLQDCYTGTDQSIFKWNFAEFLKDTLAEVATVKKDFFGNEDISYNWKRGRKALVAAAIKLQEEAFNA